MRPRAAALLVAIVALPAAAPADAATPGPPTFAFHSLALDRPLESIQVRMQAVHGAGVRIVLLREGRRIGWRRTELGSGRSTVLVHIGPHTLAKLHPGLHVDVTIFYGPAEPIRIRGVELSAAEGGFAARELAEAS